MNPSALPRRKDVSTQSGLVQLGGLGEAQPGSSKTGIREVSAKTGRNF
jgi:hypothetical protein